MKRRALRGAYMSATLAASAVFVSTLASPAMADEPELPPGSGTTIVKSTSSSSSHTESEVVAVNGISVESDVTVLAFIRANGLPDRMQKDCYRLKRGQWLWTDYKTIYGIRWHRKWFPAGSKFCENNGVVRDVICGNRVRHTRPPAHLIVHGKVKIVHRLLFKSLSKAAVEGSTSSEAFAWVNTEECKAWARGFGYAQYRATAFGYASAWTRIRSKQLATGNALHQLEIENQTEFDLKIKSKAKAEGEATTDASAGAQCETTPGEENAPPQLFVVVPPHVAKGGSQAVWMEAKDSDGTVGTPVATNDSFARIVSIIPVNIRWDGTPCPTGTSCFRGTLWGDQVGMAHLKLTVTDDDGAVAEVPLDIEVFDPNVGFRHTV